MNLLKFIFFGGICFPLFFAEAGTLTEGIHFTNSGQLQKAKGIFVSVINSKENRVLEKAIAYKNLGTVKFRLGEPFQQEFEVAEKIFITELQNNESAELRKQYGYMLYQKANCLLSACENQLAQAKMQGIESIPFRYINDYISPATKVLSTAKSYYPSEQKSDIQLLEIELAVVESHVWGACGQIEAANRAVSKALELANKVLNADKIAPDTKKKLLLRKAELLLIDNSATQGIEDKAEKLLMDAQEIQSGNTELDLSVLTFYAKFILKYKNASLLDYATLEKTIRNATEKLEMLRIANLETMDFIAKKNYFATRTELYEVLMMLYAKQNKPFDMLMTMNQIRSRAIQDFTTKDKISSQEQLQAVLAENKGMLLAYYVGVEHVWCVSFTHRKTSISQTKRSGQEIAAICWNVLQVYSDVRHPQAYVRYGSQYKILPEAFRLSNILYLELFEKYYQTFMQSKLEHLYVMPSNVLNYLPLSTLVEKIDESDIFKSRFVADNAVPLSYLVSVNNLANKQIPNKNGNALIFARGDYSYPAHYNNDPTNPDNPMAQPLNLPEVAGEGLKVSKLLKAVPEDLLREKEASEYNLIQKTQSPRSVVHVASHAHLNNLSPLNSYLVLAAGHGEDGKVKVSELLSRYRMKIHADLLVLSACDTNRGEMKLLPGDDIAALSNAFLVAGAKNVIATEWPASDTSFPQIMELFYNRVSAGEKYDAALAYALKQYLSQDQVLMRYPIFWGNVVLTGEKQ